MLQGVKGAPQVIRGWGLDGAPLKGGKAIPEKDCGAPFISCVFLSFRGDYSWLLGSNCVSYMLCTNTVNWSQYVAHLVWMLVLNTCCKALVHVYVTIQQFNASWRTESPPDAIDKAVCKLCSISKASFDVGSILMVKRNG